jgi:hypothetical protein
VRATLQGAEPECVEIDAAATAASIRDLRATVEVDANNIRALARIAEIHEHRC